MHYQTLTPVLLRTLSGAPERPKLAILGAGSVGSKLAMHAARSGQDIVAISDEGEYSVLITWRDMRWAVAISSATKLTH